MIDCFLFFNDLDMLEIRLNSLAPYIERFVLCESTVAFNGQPKPLYFQENKERFKDFNITHLIADDGQLFGVKKDADGIFSRAHYQREFLMNGIKDVGHEEMILISDMDEIPNLENYNQSEGTFLQKLYCYYCNAYTGNSRWIGGIAIKRKNLNRPIHQLMYEKKKRGFPLIENGGWHFTSTGSEESFLYKLDCSCHCYLNDESYKIQALENRKNLVDPYHNIWTGRIRPKKFKIEIPSGPQWLLDNKDRYPYLWK